MCYHDRLTPGARFFLGHPICNVCLTKSDRTLSGIMLRHVVKDGIRYAEFGELEVGDGLINFRPGPHVCFTCKDMGYTALNPCDEKNTAQVSIAKPVKKPFRKQVSTMAPVQDEYDLIFQEAFTKIKTEPAKKL